MLTMSLFSLVSSILLIFSSITLGFVIPTTLNEKLALLCQLSTKLPEDYLNAFNQCFANDLQRFQEGDCTEQYSNDFRLKYIREVSDEIKNCGTFSMKTRISARLGGERGVKPEDYPCKFNEVRYVNDRLTAFMNCTITVNASPSN